MFELTDNALMLKVKSGDLEKMGLLYERHKKKLFGFFYNINSNASLSEDLVQNVFVRMMKYRHTFTGQGQFLAWMFSTARNVQHDLFKKNNKHRSTYEIGTVEYKVEDTDDQESLNDRKDAISILNRALLKLPKEKREILILRKFKEMKFSEIGEVLGCSEGAAKVKAHRALKELKHVFMQMEIQ